MKIITPHFTAEVTCNSLDDHIAAVDEIGEVYGFLRAGFVNAIVSLQGPRLAAINGKTLKEEPARYGQFDVTYPDGVLTLTLKGGTGE